MENTCPLELIIRSRVPSLDSGCCQMSDNPCYGCENVQATGAIQRNQYHKLLII